MTVRLRARACRCGCLGADHPKGWRVKLRGVHRLDPPRRDGRRLLVAVAEASIPCEDGAGTEVYGIQLSGGRVGWVVWHYGGRADEE